MATAPWWWAPLITVIGAPLLGALLYFFVPLLRAAQRLRIWISDPPWWIPQIVVALLVGLAVLGAQKVLDDSRADRDRDIAANQARHAEQLENLRFVRQLSTQTGIARPFSGFDLRGQNLSQLDLTGAQLIDANLQGANLIGSDLTPPPLYSPLYSRFGNGTNLSGANMTGANLTNANLSRVWLARANLTNANLSGTQLSYAWLGHEVHEPVVNLTNANLHGANLYKAHLDGAYLTGANLTGAHMTGANLTEVDLTGANLTGVHCDEKTRWPVGFKPPLCG
jgi:uncharacterized protein YjbI with pentapeptide repeats